MMIDLFLPLLIGAALGVEPDGATPQPHQVAEAAPAVELPLSEGTGDHLTADMAPEDQTPTGKFTTATEVRPILEVTKPSWIAVRDFNGQDYVYFTQILSWRCGLWDIRYGLNGAPVDQVLPMEPCYIDTATPNAMTEVEMFPPYIVAAPGSVESVTVELVLDDGTTDQATYQRNEVLLP
ncbi:MAG: hypothetical protein AAGL89_11830 [Pseudomonadota bacterium]